MSAMIGSVDYSSCFSTKHLCPLFAYKAPESAADSDSVLCGQTRH